jgi:hypothetical protein
VYGKIYKPNEESFCTKSLLQKTPRMECSPIAGKEVITTLK